MRRAAAMLLLLTRRGAASGAIDFTDDDGHDWATFESVNYRERCTRCGAEISRGLWRAKSHDYICRDHAQVVGEEGA